MSPDAPRNIPVPDALAAVRAQLKALETEEAELKRILLTDPSARTGAAWIAEVKEVTRATPDLREMRANYPDLVAEFTHDLKHLEVKLHGITEDGEIVSARQMRNIEKAT